MRNKIIIGLAVVAVALLIWVYFFQDKKLETVRICFPPSLIATLPHWVAMEKGFYQAEGIAPNEIPFADSKTMTSSLYNNDADFLPAVSLADFVNASKENENKLPSLIISHSRMISDPAFESLIVLKNSPIVSLKDLENRKIAVYPGITSLNTVKFFLSSKGVDVSTIDFRPLPPPEHKDLLLSGAIDCSHLYEPLKTQALLTTESRELFKGVYPSFNEPSAIGISVISRKLFVDNPELAKRLVRVWDRAVRYIRENDAEARRILQAKMKLGEEVAKQATWVNVTTSDETSLQNLEATVKSLQKIGLADAKFELSDNYLLTK